MEPGGQTFEIEKNLLLGKVNAIGNPLFVMVNQPYASRDGIYLLAEAYEAFRIMHEAAARDGIGLMIWSGFRSFDHQKRIWDNKWSGKQKLEGNLQATDINNKTERATKILRFSAMPGTSRHHWGTDIDLNSLSNSYFKSGKGLKINNWLQKNAAMFGFFQPYTEFGNSRTSGHSEEKWHWSYLPISNKYLDGYLKTVTIDDIKGFEGDFTAREVDVIQNYILGINREILDQKITPH